MKLSCFFLSSICFVAASIICLICGTGQNLSNREMFIIKRNQTPVRFTPAFWLACRGSQMEVQVWPQAPPPPQNDGPSCVLVPFHLLHPNFHALHRSHFLQQKHPGIRQNNEINLIYILLQRQFGVSKFCMGTLMSLLRLLSPLPRELRLSSNASKRRSTKPPAESSRKGRNWSEGEQLSNSD